jgi:two-component system cell cycle response regulator
MPGRVLIVDDIRPNITLLEAKLTSEYYDVIAADSGHKAIDLAKRESPDLILLDIMMPGLDGFKTCEILKSDPTTAHIPIIMVTALSDPADRVRGLEAGADDFLSKPVRDLPLFARVRSLIRLKLLMDVYLVREETSNRLGLVAPQPLLAQEDATHGRLLVIDDSEVDVANLIQTLTPDDHQVTRLTAIDQGLAVASREDFDLLIVTLHLAQGDVLRFCSQIRSHVADRVRSLPILLLAEDEEDVGRVAKGLDLGVNDYLLKPVDPQELLARVRTQIRRRRYQNRLRVNYEQSIALASTDPLTGVHNRRYLDTHLDQLLQRARANNKPLSVAFCDIDHFKRLNDSYGHAAGDEVLIEFTRRMIRNLRSLDLVARIGGEEFVVVMPDTPPERARRIGERLRQKVEQEPFMVSGFEPIVATISVGVTTSRPSDGLGIDLIKRADEAMYQAKHAGRNRVVVAGAKRPAAVERVVPPQQGT